jgi:hypothetical protein
MTHQSLIQYDSIIKLHKFKIYISTNNLLPVILHCMKPKMLPPPHAAFKRPQLKASNTCIPLATRSNIYRYSLNHNKYFKYKYNNI